RKDDGFDTVDVVMVKFPFTVATWACDLLLARLSHAPVLFLSTCCALSAGCASYLPLSGPCIHSGVLGIYATSSGCCVTFHQPLRDLTVKELVISYDNNIPYRGYNVNEKLH